jgi:predicted nucleotidyltransferase component of viral defense system
VLSYGEHDINIKIDVSRKIWKSNQYEIVNFYGTDIRVQDKATIFANKLVALTERSTNRDIYDVWFFFKNMFPISEAVIRERTGKTTKELLKEVEQKLQKLEKHYNILDGLGEVLTEKQKYFVREKLITELIGIVSFYQNF